MKSHLLLSVISIIIFCVHLNAQNAQKLNTYKAESDGYYCGISVSEFGLIATDNYASNLYLIKNGKSEIIHSSAGCGRYYTLSPEKNIIGFKLITADGKQIPALLDINSRKISQLHAPVDLCGQVSFSTNGTIAFTIGSMLHVVQGTTEQIFDLGSYSNISPISPDGNFVVYNDDHDQLHIINLLTNTSAFVTNSDHGFAFPQWSPDGRKILFSTLSSEIYVFDLRSNDLHFISEGSNASWSDDSKYVVFNRIVSDDFVFKGSDIFIANFDGTSVHQVTNTSDIHEMGAVFSGNRILYHTYNMHEIFTSILSPDKLSLGNKQKVYSNPGSLQITHFQNAKSVNAETRVPGTVPYVNQVYDTPSWHYGYGSCAPTTAIMAIAYFNRLPKWPTAINANGSVPAHNSDYGSYVADRYRFNEYYYQDVATANGANAYGGYGYMWTGSYSPHSRMRQYMSNHYMTSVQEDADNWTKAMTQINNGYPFSVCNLLTTAGHLTLGIGYIQGQHTMIFNDPYGDKNHTSWPNWYGQDAYYDWPGYNNGFQNLNTVAWTVTNETSEVAYNDTLIDDVFYNHGFYINNSLLGSTQRYFHDQNAGYNNHFWFTGTVNTTPDICFVTWTPTIPQSGDYEVFAYLPGGTNANAQNAQYKIYFNGGQNTVVVNQSLYSNQWVSLGTYNFLQGQAGYVYLGDSTGIASENLAWDAMKFSKAGPQDIIAPTTSVSSQGIWKTSDFTATFTDQDDAGGSGIEKAYYQVLDYDGQNWGANSNRGFFVDNFDAINSSIWNVPANSGIWSSANGYLFQSDSTNTNTNIYVYVNQNISNRTLYHFSARIESQPYLANQRRLGFHFFCDTGSTLNRSDSYFIFFRQETSKLEFYKVLNNAFTQVKIVDNVVTNIGQLYDYKIIYDRITGKMSVYRDDVMLGTWTDPAPLTTSGNYVSFRTGHCKVSVSELKVYRSRTASTLVTVGNSSKDIRFQNPDPLTFSAKIKSIVADSVGNISTIAYHDLNVDWTPPSDVIVSDGLSNDVDTVANTSSISANWTNSIDPHSGLFKYMYAIGTTPGSTDLLGWTDNGTATVFTENGINLQNGQHYFVSVYSENNAGLISNIVVSDGIFVLNLPNAGFTCSAQNICQNDSIHFTNTSTNATSYHWTFDGGSPSVSNDMNPTVVYSNSGNFNVALVATGQGGSDTIIQNSFITINPETQAMFTTNVGSGTAPLAVLFMNSSTNADGFIWNFGEGNLVSDINPYHIYNNAGDYSVMLISLNSQCGNDTAYTTIHVDPFVKIDENFTDSYFVTVSNFEKEIIIEFTCMECNNIKFALYDLLGKKMPIHAQTERIQDKFITHLEKSTLSSGIYIFKLDVEKNNTIQQITRKLQVLK